MKLFIIQVSTNNLRFKKNTTPRVNFRNKVNWIDEKERKAWKVGKRISCILVYSLPLESRCLFSLLILRKDLWPLGILFLFFCAKRNGGFLWICMCVCMYALTGKTNDNALGNEFFESKGSRQPPDHWL